MDTWDSGTLSNVKKIPLLTVRSHAARQRAARLLLRRSARVLTRCTSQVRAGPRDGDAWTQRLKEEYQALIKYVQARVRRCAPPPVLRKRRVAASPWACSRTACWQPRASTRCCSAGRRACASAPRARAYAVAWQRLA